MSTHILQDGITLHSALARSGDPLVRVERESRRVEKGELFANRGLLLWDECNLACCVQTNPNDSE